MSLLYQLFLLGFFCLLHTGRFFSKKIRSFRKSRKQGFHSLEKILNDNSCQNKGIRPSTDTKKKKGQKQKKSGRYIIWLHAASAGEAQQASDLAQTLGKKLHIPTSLSNGQKTKQKKTAAIYEIILSITSQSVPLPINNNSLIQKQFFSHIFYLPVDFAWNWRSLFRKAPHIKCFIAFTWDVWPNLLRNLRKQKTKCFLCSASYDKKYWKADRLWKIGKIGKIWKRFQYSFLDGIGTVTREDAILIKKMIAPRNPQQSSRSIPIHAIGDSRYRHILQKKKQKKEDQYPIGHSRWTGCKQSRPIGKKIIFFASTYFADEKIFIPLLPKLYEKFPQILIYIFPHHVHAERIQSIKQQLKQEQLAARLWSHISNNKSMPGHQDIILVDRLGILAQAYAHCFCCYVGGGFHHRIHNVAEPAAYGKTILTGPRISSSPIACELHKKKFLITCKDQNHLFHAMQHLLKTPKKTQGNSKKIMNIISEKSDASKHFFEKFLAKYLC